MTQKEIVIVIVMDGLVTREERGETTRVLLVEGGPEDQKALNKIFVATIRGKEEGGVAIVVGLAEVEPLCEEPLDDLHTASISSREEHRVSIEVLLAQ